MKKLGNTTKKGTEGKAPERGLTLNHRRDSDEVKQDLQPESSTRFSDCRE